MEEQIGSNEEGAKAIIYLQSLAGITDYTMGRALKEWNDMDDYMKKSTMSALSIFGLEEFKVAEKPPKENDKKRIALANGQFLDVPDDFVVDDKNLVKINLRDDKDGFSEGIWAWISENDANEFYEKDYTGSEYHVALLANKALMGIPWGCYIPIKYCGDKRPISVKQWLDLDAEPCIEISLYNKDNKE